MATIRLNQRQFGLLLEAMMDINPEMETQMSDMVDDANVDSHQDETMPENEPVEMNQPEIATPVVQQQPRIKAYTPEDIRNIVAQNIQQCESEYQSIGKADENSIRSIVDAIIGKTIIIPEQWKATFGKYGYTFEWCFGSWPNDNPEPDFCGWELKSSTSTNVRLFSKTENNNALSEDSPLIPSLSFVEHLKKIPSRTFMFTMNQKGEMKYDFGENKAINDLQVANLSYVPIIEKQKDYRLKVSFHKKAKGKELSNDNYFGFLINTPAIADVAWHKLHSCVHVRSIPNKNDTTLVSFDNPTYYVANSEKRFTRDFADMLVHSVTKPAVKREAVISLLGTLTFDETTRNVTVKLRFQIGANGLKQLYDNNTKRKK